MSVQAISFLSDYGLDDEFVGVCHGVIARRCPAARVIDITHRIPRQDILAGALVLAASLPHMPAGVHLAVVDPGVGDPSRRAVALSVAAGERLLVGPDNGLLWPAAQALGGVGAAADISASPERLQPVSATFHGRDVFAPVAAALACGVPLAAAGEPIDPSSLRALLPGRAVEQGSRLLARVLLADGFGNLSTDAGEDQLSRLGIAPGAPLSVTAQGPPRRALRAATFSDVPEGALLLHVDSRGMVALAVNHGSAAELLGAGPGGLLALERL